MLSSTQLFLKQMVKTNRLRYIATFLLGSAFSGIFTGIWTPVETIMEYFKSKPNVLCVESKTEPSFAICPFQKEEDLFVSGSIRDNGICDSDLTYLLRTSLSLYQNAMFIELGAFIGYFALYAGSLDHEVLAVEPFNSSFRKLRQGLLLKNFPTAIKILNKAVSKKRSFVSMGKYQMFNPGNLQVNPEAHNDDRKDEFKGDMIETITMDDLLEYIHLNQAIIKMDIELRHNLTMKARRAKLLLLFAASGFIIFILTSLPEGDYRVKRPRLFQNVDYLAKKLLRKSSKTILLWTEYDHDEFRYMKTVREYLRHCPYNCSVTNNQNELSDSDALFFRLTDIWVPNWEIGTKKTLLFPSESHPEQIWIIENSEPPFSFFGNVDIFEDIFNWTMWYRSDATLVVPYGRYIPHDKVDKMLVKKSYKKRDIYSEKSKFIVGAISNCKDPGRRYLLVEEMSKYLDFTMFGQCYNKNMCGTSWIYDNADCHEELKKYRFYLAFESNQCKDYITEKYWNALDRGQIPIVNWKRKDILTGYIPDSYINVYEFPSVKEFSEYIKLVDTNSTLYNSYFEWLNDFSLDLTTRVSWCNLCEKVHRLDQKYERQRVNFKQYLYSDVCLPLTREIHDREATASAAFFGRKNGEKSWFFF